MDKKELLDLIATKRALNLAAPDMLEALKALLAADRMECKPGTDDELRKVAAQVYAEGLAERAIAKAEKVEKVD